MASDRGLSAGEALTKFRSTNGLDPDSATAATWLCRIGPLTLRLPNFGWRRSAIDRHDLHHLLTGYPCTISGECQVATWEFAAGRYPHPAATLFCLPLVALGLVWSPRAVWRAFLSGRRGRSLYHRGSAPDLFRVPLDLLRGSSAPYATPISKLADTIAFLILLFSALAVTLAPALLMAIALLAL